MSACVCAHIHTYIQKCIYIHMYVYVYVYNVYLSGVTDFFKASLARKQKSNVPTYYMPMFEDDVHYDWFVNQVTIDMVDSFVKDELTIPGASPEKGDVPSNLVEQPPAKPTMNVMTFLSDKADSPGEPRGIKIPDSCMSTWLHYKLKIYAPPLGYTRIYRCTYKFTPYTRLCIEVYELTI